MIYVTVGTHDQPFTRLVKAMDEIAAELDERVVIQRGASPYTPRHAEYVDIVSRKEAEAYMREARLVVAQGGSGTIFTAIQMGKPLVIMPRRREYREHIDDHQVGLARALEGREGIWVVYDEQGLQAALDLTVAPTPNSSREKLFATVREYVDGLARQKAQRKRWPTVVLLGILILALALRLWGIGWGLPNGQRRSVSYHPDENTYLHEIATINPAEFDFVIDNESGQAFVPYILAALLKGADLVGWFELRPSEDFYIAHPEEAAKIYLLGRSISVVSGMLSVLLIYSIVRKAFAKAPWWLAPLGALFLAVAPGHVVNCHYLETDAPVTFFVLLTVYLMVNMVRLGCLRDYALVGISTGLAIGTKWSALPLLPLLFIAHCIRQPVWWRPAVVIGKGQFKRLLVLGLSLVVAFLVANPYFALHPATAARRIHQMGSTSFLVSGGGSSLLTGSIELLTEILPFSLSWGLYLLGCAGAFLVLLDHRRTAIGILSLTWILLFSPVAASHYKATVGRTLPLAPFFVVLAVSALAHLCNWATRSRLRLTVSVILVALFVCLALGTSVVTDLFFCSDTAREDASRWIVENAPPGTVFGLYHQDPYWDDPDVLYQDFYHPAESGPQYQYEIYPLDANDPPWPDSDYLIFTHRDASMIEGRLDSEKGEALLRWMDERYEVAAEFESAVHVLGFEFRGFYRSFPTPRIQILRLEGDE